MIGWLASKVFMMGAKANVKKLQNSPKLFGAFEDYRKDTITSRIKFKIIGTTSPEDLVRAMRMSLANKTEDPEHNQANYRKHERLVNFLGLFGEGANIEYSTRNIQEIRKNWDLFPLIDIEESGCRQSPDWKDGIKRLRELKPGSTLCEEARDPKKRHRYLTELSKKWEKEFRGENQHPPSSFTGEPSYNASYIYKLLTRFDYLHHQSGAFEKFRTFKKYYTVYKGDVIRSSYFKFVPVETEPASEKNSIFKLGGRIKIGEFREAFQDVFRCILHVYDGIKFAEDSATTSSVSVKTNKLVKKFSLSPQVKIGRFKQDLWEHFGLRVQVYSSAFDLIHNELTLGEAAKVEFDSQRGHYVSEKWIANTLNIT